MMQGSQQFCCARFLNFSSSSLQFAEIREADQTTEQVAVFPGLVDVPGFKGRFTLQDWFRFVVSDWDLGRDPWQLVDQAL
jgi:hypothetical protein